MIGFIIIIIVFGGLFFLYFNSITSFIKALITCAISLQFILAKVNFLFTNLSFVFLYLFMTILLILTLAKVINNRHFRVVVGSQILFIFYIFSISLVRGSFLQMLDFTKFYFLQSILFSLIVSSRKNSDKIQIDRFIITLVLFLSILAISQYLLPIYSNFFVPDLSSFGYNVGKSDQFKRVVGLSISPTNFGNILALLLIYIAHLYHKIEDLKISKVIFVLCITLGFLALILTGIRTSLVSFIVGILLIGLLNINKRLIFIIFVSTILFFSAFDKIIEIGSQYSNEEGFSNPIGRTFQFFSMIKDGGISSESTLSLSLIALKDFFNNPLFGSGDEMNWLQAFSISDAYFLYHLVQFGIVGLFIIYIPYLYTINQNRNKIIFVLFITLVLQTFTDTGLFNNTSNIIFWSLAAINNENKY